MSPSKSTHFFRLFFMLCSVVITLVIVTPLAALFFFDPNDFKPQLSQFITDKTGLPLEIQGHIDLKIFPRIGLNVEQVALSQPPFYPSGKFIEVGELEFQIPLEEALRFNFNIEALVIKKLKLHVIKSQNGHTNWDDFIQQMKQKHTRTRDSDNQSKPSASKQKHLTFAITQFDVQDAHIIYQDDSIHQTITLDHFNLTGKNHGEKIYPLTSSFDAILTRSSKTLLQAKAKLTGEAVFQPNSARLNLQNTVDFVFLNQMPTWSKANLSSYLEVDPTKGIKLDKIDLTAANIKLTGNCLIPHNAKEPISFLFRLNQLNTSQLPNFTFDTQKTNKEIASNSSSSTRFEKNSAIQDTKDKNRKWRGEVTVQSLTVKDLHLRDVRAKIKMENQLLQVQPLQANLYEGRLDLQASKNLNISNSPISLKGKLLQIQIQPLLQDLKHKEILSGKGDVDFAISYSDLSGATGTAQFSIQDGNLNKIDIPYYIHYAQSLLHKEANTLSNTYQTPFGTLSGKLVIHDKVIDSNDLLLTSPHIQAHGEGSFDLDQQTIFFKMIATKQYHDGKEHPNALPLALRIKGPIQKPKVEPDLDVYLKTSVKQALKKELNKQLEKHLHKMTPTEAPSENTSEETKDTNHLQDKIDKEINRGLKKLFKL